MVRKSFMKVLLVAFGLVVYVTGAALASSAAEKNSVPPEDALRKLMDGNEHFVKNTLTNATRSDAAARASLAHSQKPYAIILSCSDSRVPPEVIFDKGLGEIFVIRVAGNIPDPIVLGSIEYAADHLGTSLIMVLGHERCGAVTATVDAKGESTGSKNIDAIVTEIEPSVDLAIKDCPACKDEENCAATKKSEFVNCAIDNNVKIVAANLTKNSEILRHLAEEKKIKIVAAKYDLDDGIVTLVE